MVFRPTYPIYVIDFEGSLSAGIVEYGVVGIYEGEIFETHSRLCRALAPIPDNEVRCHGISFETTLRFPPFASDSEFFLKRRQSGPFAAHNALFEDRLLRNEWPVPGQVPRFLENNAQNGWGPWIDTYCLYRRCFPNAAGFALSELIDSFKLNDALACLGKLFCKSQRRNYHCALFDALACSLLLLKLLENSDAHPLSLDWLFIHSASGKKQFEAMNQQELF